jgi:nucleolar MIF4G domain-containing protein 1
MWDFLRELGESNVGGMELLKRQQDEGFASDGKTVGKTKVQNVAKAYAWWIAKDNCSLAILKVGRPNDHNGVSLLMQVSQPVDFTILKAQTHLFLKELLLQIFIGSQISTPAIAENTKLLLEKSSRNRAALEEIFIKVTRIETLAMGLLYFVSEAFQKELTTDGFMSWAVEVVKDGLRTGVDVGSDL